MLFITSLFSGILLAKTSDAQSIDKIRISLELENEDLSHVFKEIEQKSGLSFTYHFNKSLFNDNPSRISLVSKNETLSKILYKIAEQSGLSFKQVNENISVQIRDASLFSKSAVPEAFIENVKITGSVLDERGNSIPGATILVKGRTIGTATDIDGKFSLDVPENATLVVSFVGYVTKEILVGNQEVFNIVLQEDAAQLDEVVVVGYGSQKKSDLTGAISSLNADDLTSGGTVSNVAQAIQGRASGVVVTQNSKAPGGSMSIRIRGANSVSSSNEPLYVVDGFPTDNGININPEDIASMEILKDASATAIYGSRGANGVVLITTKRGKEGQGNIAVNAYTSTQNIIVPFDMLNGQDYMYLANDLYKEIDGQENINNGAYTPSQLASDVSTDWIEATTRRSLVQNYSLQITGGSEKTKVLTSIGYFDQEGVLKNTNFSRLSGRVNVDHEINDFIKSGATIMAQRENSNYQVYDGNILNSNVLYSILTYDPTVPVYNQDGSFARPPGGRGDNPLANLTARQNDVQKSKLNGSMFLELNLAKGLKARMDAGTEIREDRLGGYLSKDSYQGGINDGVANLSNYSLTHNLFDIFVTYEKLIKERHALQVMGGYSYEKYINESNGINVYGFSTDLYGYNNVGAASTITGVSSSKTENILISFFGRANYSLDDKYLFTFTVRSDGSSRFGEDNKWGIFPSGSFAWRVIDESFMENQSLFSDLKFRAGYGRTGNERIGNYASYGLVSTARYTFDGVNNTAGTFLNSSSPENSKLKWETTDQFNAGLDFSLLDNRLKFNIDGYYKRTDNLLIRVNLPKYSGYASGLSNVGATENKGLEFNMEYQVPTNNQFSWKTGLNFAINKNKVLSLGDQSEILLTSSKPIGNVSEESYAIIQEGKPLGSLYGYKYVGVLQEGETYAPQPNSKAGDPMFEDLNGDGLITSADRGIIGSAYPKFTFGFNNSFMYKNFDLSLFFYGKVGNDLLNMTRMNLEWNRTAESLNRWTPENTDTDIPRNGFFYSQYGGYINDHFIEDASFLRLRNVTLGYNIPLQSNAVQSIRVYAMGENLFTISGYSGWDPEVDTKGYENDNLVKYGGNAQSANAGAGLDFNSYPSMRTFTIGISAKF
ncbi:TonB-dependent receptor [Echinicola sp. CAU 1574]|uniref:TonB-dependent receptor n=1 Tax=Echinicola arenosa TaxID=2774144 RepID=A0ABR9AHX8_9BACT|nr:TonB-dependent receptor [Echinicola arenosa]